MSKLLAWTDTNRDGKMQFTEFWSWIGGHGEGGNNPVKEELMAYAIEEDRLRWEREQQAKSQREAAEAARLQRGEDQERKEAEREAGDRISKKEFVDAHVDVGINKHMASNMFAQGDEDRDGEIDRQERGWMAAENATTGAQVKGLFKESAQSGPGGDEAIMDGIINTFTAWDKDGDGTVSNQELIRVIRTLNPRLGQKTAESMIKQADVNGDGFIDIREFVGWISGVNPKKKKAKEIHEAKMACAAHKKRASEAKEYGLQGDFEEFLHRSFPSFAEAKRIPMLCGTLNKVPAEGQSCPRLCTSCHNRHGWLCHGCGFVSFSDECVNDCGFGPFGWTCLQGACKKKCGCKKKPAIWQRRGFLQDLEVLSKDVKTILQPPTATE